MIVAENYVFYNSAGLFSILCIPYLIWKEIIIYLLACIQFLHESSFAGIEGTGIYSMYLCP